MNNEQEIMLDTPPDKEPFDCMLWLKTVAIFWLVLLVGVMLTWITH